MSDRALLAECSGGDREALATLFDRHHRDVYAFLARVEGPHSRDLEDLVQQTFIEAFRSASRFKGDRAKSWLFGIALNLLRNRARGDARRRSFVAKLSVVVGREAPPSAESFVEGRRLLDRLESALGALPHDLRVAFVLCEIEGLSGVEAAQALDVRPGTLWRRLHDARKALRAELGEIE